MDLHNLRINPRETIESRNFFVNHKNIPGVLGGNVLIQSQRKSSGVNILKIYPGGDDFYFPYNAHTSDGGYGYDGIGSVNIQEPVRSGTIAITGGMNGCALDVYFKNAQYLFVHDNNGRYANNIINPGVRVCRIEAEAYWGGFDPARRYNNAPVYSICQFICIYANNYWHVGCFGTVKGFNRSTRQSSDIVDAFEPLGGKYRGYFNANIHLIQRSR